MFKNKITGEEGYLRASREDFPQIENEAGVCIDAYETLSELLEKWEEVEEVDKPDIDKLMQRLERRVAELEDKVVELVARIVGREALK